MSTFAPSELKDGYWVHSAIGQLYLSGCDSSHALSIVLACYSHHLDLTTPGVHPAML